MTADYSCPYVSLKLHFFARLSDFEYWTGRQNATVFKTTPLRPAGESRILTTCPSKWLTAACKITIVFVARMTINYTTAYRPTSLTFVHASSSSLHSRHCTSVLNHVFSTVSPPNVLTYLTLRYTLSRGKPRDATVNFGRCGMCRHHAVVYFDTRDS